MNERKVGLWLIGARGSVGATIALGVAALRRGLCDQTGLVTSLPMFSTLDLDLPGEFVIGGHDIASTRLMEAACRVGGGTPAFAANVISACTADLEQWNDNIKSGTTWSHESIKDQVMRIQTDILEFRCKYNLSQIVVINVASTEPTSLQVGQCDSAKLQSAINRNELAALPPSGWYAYAAISVGYPYVNFTPSCGANVPALLQLADELHVPVAGQDGKTGETLVKTVLAPMFVMRNLKVLSWVGHNMLGNNDGRVLSDPTNRTEKLKNKDRVVADILGYAPHSLTSIDFVESLDDWKTAWDHIHFQGFLGVRMSMQFTWQGCDSALAAPLILDLARLVLLAQRRGEYGTLKHLAMFFKSPMGIGEHDLAKQWALMEQYVRSVGA